MKQFHYLFMKLFKPSTFLILICVSNSIYGYIKSNEQTKVRVDKLVTKEKLNLVNNSIQNDTIFYNVSTNYKRKKPVKKIEKIFNLLRYFDITYKYYQVLLFLFRIKNLANFQIIRYLA